MSDVAQLDVPQKCPSCRNAVEDHWSLALNDEERREWKAPAGTCHRSRGEVLRLIAQVADGR